jgi:NitT/TauT family transport system ATP-binding protein
VIDAASSTPVVRVSGVDKTFGTSTGAVRALEGIDLTIAQGEFVSLIGPSGCGKSTLLRLVGDLTAPSAGSIEVNGKPARRARLDRDYGMVFQAPVLMDWRTVAKNIELPLEIMGFGRSERERRSGELLKLVELESFAGRHPWQLSGGMQQRVAIARALAFDPKLLLMDEPFGALDEMTRERMNLELMQIWQRTRTTVVFVTHSIPEAVFLSTRVVVMSPRPGRIAKVVDIDLPQPRNAETRDQERYFELVTEVRDALRRREGGEEPPAPPNDDRIRAEGLA